MTGERVVRRLAAITALTGAVGLAMPATAETWLVQATLKYGSSPDICAEYEPVSYTLEISSGTISGTGGSGKLFSAIVPVSGLIRFVYKSGWGDRFEIAGNVKMKQLEIVHMNSGCRWILESVI
jgi:hypothetical protein